ncbi:MAG TPA: ATP-binding cassette domain-containing protein [Spirochaetota bacterium]|jgi:Fe-S cluster assembly ATP-binding protein|nr:ATP-binding cassette domain-containing protein [Spirochaetota bacterium]HOF13274.1 ATP-binding cassette domain-containing protein [Spirochaetota bacterium]HOM87313.1 ATP-binding cassette domain-containing protein [Spirochaetota bacterium]HOR92466.1 ATP-binding cassette domain-containing protein [Spirochaetota bacterium]HOT18828.1 ATP-binding cassette domain-containing protein [Spirochaetota bacterium]
MAILKLENVSLSLNNKPILDSISVDFWEGYIHAIVGPNGAGKSTLSYVIMGLNDYRTISGTLYFKNKPINELSVYQRARLGISLAWQEPARFEGLTVYQYLQASKKDNGLSIEEAMDVIGLPAQEYLPRACDKTLSGGERKRIELASLLVMQPEVVLLDEPDSGIDVEALERIFDAMAILKQRGSTIITITHSMAVLQKAEHAFLMCHGNIIDKGGIDKISGYFENKCIPCDHKNIPISGEAR